MNPKTKKQLVKVVFDFLIIIATIAGDKAREIIEVAVKQWIESRSKKSKAVKRTKRRNKS